MGNRTKRFEMPFNILNLIVNELVGSRTISVKLRQTVFAISRMGGSYSYSVFGLVARMAGVQAKDLWDGNIVSSDGKLPAILFNKTFINELNTVAHLAHSKKWVADWLLGNVKPTYLSREEMAKSAGTA